MITAIPRTAIRKGVAGGDAVRRHLAPPGLERVLDGTRLNTYCECDARCSVSHLSLIQPCVLAFTSFTRCGTRILRMTTTTLNTMTALTISSIWFSTWRPPRLPYTLYRLDVLRAVLYRTAHDLRGACSPASRLCSEGHAFVALRCACALGNSAVQRRSAHLQHATRIRGTPDDESDCGRPRRGTGNPVAQLAGARCRT